MQWFCWRGVEAPADFAAGIVLCYLEGLYEALLLFVSEPNRGAIRKDWNNQGVVYLSPIGVVQAPRGVAENAECGDRGAGVGAHDLDVHVLIEGRGEVHAEVAYRWLVFDGVDAVACVPYRYVSDWGPEAFT
jgi:hypothetical protein